MIAFAYGAVAVSPLPERIARHSPERASLFRPPLFNFSAGYDEGAVLGFEIHSSREQVLNTIVTKYAGSGELWAACGREQGAPPLSVADSDVRADAKGEVRKLLEREVVCLHLPARRIVLVFHIPHDELRSIELTYVRNELVT
jgi:hypothetical protein